MFYISLHFEQTPWSWAASTFFNTVPDSHTFDSSYVYQVSFHHRCYFCHCMEWEWEQRPARTSQRVQSSSFPTSADLSKTQNHRSKQFPRHNTWVCVVREAIQSQREDSKVSSCKTLTLHEYEKTLLWSQSCSSSKVEVHDLDHSKDDSA